MNLKLKNGLSTTEFWLTIGAMLLNVVIWACGQIDAAWTVGAITALTLIYNLVRGLVKSAETRRIEGQPIAELRVSERGQ